ncbi:hypothetical protein HOD29_00680 [archaeon]|jgi:hypothetical protein|nr:hypothetical protein [archaeon]
MPHRKKVRYTPVIVRKENTNQLVHIFPTLFSIFRRSSRKKYRLILSKGTKKIILKTSSLKDLDTKVGTGVVKILETQSIPFLNIIGFALGYFLLPRFYKKIERQNKGKYLELKQENGTMKYISK